MDSSKETVFQTKQDDTHMNSQRLRQSALSLHRFKSNRVPVMRGRRGYDLPLLTKKLSAIDNL